MSQKPDLKEEIESLINYFKDTRKLTVPEAIVVMLNSIASEWTRQLRRARFAGASPHS